jgi:lipopolysaccharide export system protein LptA
MTRLLVALFCFLLPALSLHAEQSDREKPIALEADRITIDDLKRMQILEGNVVLTQGTLTIRADKIVVTEDAYGFQRGVAFAGPGGLARFRQKRETRDGWIEGEAERIEYDSHNEIAELFRRAWVKSGEDQLHGDYIRYDAISERYLAAADPGNSKNSAMSPARVRALIQPRNKSVPPVDADRNDALQLKSTPALPPPEHP